MTGRKPTPTVVIGVGQAGIDILDTITGVVHTEDADQSFDFLAIDTDSQALREYAPPEATTVYLSTPRDNFPKEIARYPYLHEDTEIGAKGTERQRPVGRYKLDNEVSPTVSDVFETIDTHLEDRYLETEGSLSSDADALNVSLIHSLGGGTGSGTYPLLAAMVAEAADRISDTHGIRVYVSGVGIVPTVKYHPQLNIPPGDPRFYANTYAALEDLRTLTSAEPGDPLDLPVYSHRFSGTTEGSSTSTDEMLTRREADSFRIETPPFDDYFLVDVNEDRIVSDSSSGQESYPEMVDAMVAESVYALSSQGWPGQGAGLQTKGSIGTVAEIEIAVPIEELGEYCQTKARIAELESTLFAGANVEYADQYIRRITRDPQTALETVDTPGAVRAAIEDRVNALELELAPQNCDRDDIEELIEDVEVEHGLRFVPFALDVLQDRIDETLPELLTEHEEVVSSLWLEYEMSPNPGDGETDVNSVEARARELRSYFETTIEEREARLADLEPSFWDDLPFIDGTRETAEAQLAALKEDLIRLTDVDQQKQRLESLRSFIENRREEVELSLRENYDELVALRNELRAERRFLTDPNRSTRRVSFLPIKDEALDDLDAETLADLDSIADFIGEYIDESIFLTALETLYEESFAWRKPILHRDFSDLDIQPRQTVKETWLLYHEANREVVETGPLNIEGQFRESSDNLVDPIADPYRLKFVSFTTGVQLEALKFYRQLKDFAKSGRLDAHLPGAITCRHAFAYPEWYGHNIRPAFDPMNAVTLPYPPELDLDAVTQQSDEPDGEFKNRIVTYGFDVYLFNGYRWDEYVGEQHPELFEGWRDALEDVGAGFRTLQRCSPDPETKRRWMAGHTDWETVIESYCQNLTAEEGIKVELEEPPTSTED